MPTPLYDAILACDVPPASERLRHRLEDMRKWTPYADLLEPLLFPQVVEALRWLAMSDEELDRGQVEVTVSVRRVAGARWRHYGTFAHRSFKLARSVLEDFVVVRLPREDDLERLKKGEEISMDDFSYGAVTRRRLPARRARRA
jgi:hypothetical protein